MICLLYLLEHGGCGLQGDVCDDGDEDGEGDDQGERNSTVTLSQFNQHVEEQLLCAKILKVQND
jgi:hypothetical protein